MSSHAPHAAAPSGPAADAREVEVLGSTTRYWVYGPESAARTVVAVHGYRGDHHGLEPIVTRLPELRIISPDLPGFGESTPMTEADHSVEGYANWLAAFLEELRLGASAIVLGHSFGTIVASAALAGRVAAPALILVNPIAISGLKGPHRFGTWITVQFYRFAGWLPRRMGEALLRNWLVVQFMSVALAKTKDRKLRRWIHREHHAFFNGFSDRDTAVEGFAASISTDVGAFARDIHVPVLLIAAELDDITPVAAQYELQRSFPDARLRVIPGVGHLIHYETPAVAAEAIADFVEGLPAA